MLQQAAVRFLDGIPRARDLLTVFFAEDIMISRYDSESQQGLMDRLQSIEGGGNTALYDALAVYVSRVLDTPGGRKVAVLFTDGEDSKSATSLGEALEVVRGSGVTVYAIAFSPDGRGWSTRRATLSRAFLNEVTRVSGGDVFTPNGYRDLPDIYDRILRQLEAQYVIGFVSDRTEHDGRFRKLKVELAREGLPVEDLRLSHRYPDASRSDAPTASLDAHLVPPAPREVGLGRRQPRRRGASAGAARPATHTPSSLRQSTRRIS